MLSRRCFSVETMLYGRHKFHNDDKKEKLFMRMTQRILASACTVLFLAGCMANSATQSGTAPARASGGFLGLGEASDFNVDTGKAFAGANKVVIGGFKVGFVESKIEKIKAGGGLMGSGFGGKSTAFLKLAGVDSATQQKLTDAAYADFVSKLKANGYEIVDRSTLMNHDEFKSVKMYDMPFEKDSSGLLNDYGMIRYFAPTAFGKQSPIFIGEVAGETGGFGFANPMAPSSEFAKQTGIRVLNVTYVMDFANSEKYGGFARNSSSVNVGQGLSIIPGALVGINGGHGGSFSTNVGVIRTGQAVYTTDEFATVEDVTGGTSKVVEKATNVIGILGGIGSNVSRKYDVKADGVKYAKYAGKVLTDTNSSFVAQMTSLR